jgi:hypothetical protein
MGQVSNLSYIDFSTALEMTGGRGFSAALTHPQQRPLVPDLLSGGRYVLAQPGQGNRRRVRSAGSEGAGSLWTAPDSRVPEAVLSGAEGARGRALRCAPGRLTVQRCTGDATTRNPRSL